MAEGQQGGVDAVLQRGAVTHQVQPPAGPFPLTADPGVGSQIAGTRSRRDSSASTQASILSVLQASGANPFTFTASAISTSQPRSSSWSWTKRAPFIDSITAATGPPSSPTR